MKKIAIAIVAVIALLANVNLSAQSVDDQIAQINAMDRDVVFNFTAEGMKQSFGKNNVKADLKKRVITITESINKDLGDATSADLKKELLKEIAGDNSAEKKIFKAIMLRGQFSLLFQMRGNDKTLSCTLYASDIK